MRSVNRRHRPSPPRRRSWRTRCAPDPPPPRFRTSGAALAWLGDAADDVVKVDVRTNLVVGVVQMPAGSFPHDITFDGKFMWVTAADPADPNKGKVFKYLAHL